MTRLNLLVGHFYLAISLGKIGGNKSMYYRLPLQQGIERPISKVCTLIIRQLKAC